MLEIKQLCVKQGSKKLVHDLDWQVSKGECWAVLGQNGVGKTTLLRTMAGLHPAESDCISLAGQPLAALSRRKLALQLAYLSQSRQDAFSYTVLETVLAARFPYQGTHYWDSRADYEAAQDALAEMDLSAMVNRNVQSLSGGERQRVAIAAVLAQQTPLLLLDEPNSSLDMAHQLQLMNMLKSLCTKDGKTVVMVMHDLNLVQLAATHVLLLYGEGRWEAGPVSQMMQAEKLSDCFNCPLKVTHDASRSFFMPGE